MKQVLPGQVHLADDIATSTDPDAVGMTKYENLRLMRLNGQFTLVSSVVQARFKCELTMKPRATNPVDLLIH
jgi:hypothetical protein